jgi:hypothetical protein
VLDLDVGGGTEADTERAAVMTDFTADLGPSGGTPRLDFVHALLPHGGWTFLPSGARYVGPHPPTGNVFFTWVDDYAGAAGRARHLLQTQYTDALLGDALDRLRELGTYDESLIVVTADHGVSFRRGESLRAPRPNTYPDVMWTPLFIKAPGQTSGELVEAPSRSIDVLPTMADHLGIDVPWDIDGTSLLHPRDDGHDVRILASSPGAPAEAEDDYLVFDGDEGYRKALALGGQVPNDPLGVYRIPPHGSLVGTPVEEIATGEPSDITAGLDDPEAYDDVDPEADELPVYVTGSLTSEHHVEVAVAVNGVLGGWCETEASSAPDLPGEEDKPFWVVVPESLLRPGGNDVTLYELGDSGGAPLLRRITLD